MLGDLGDETLAMVGVRSWRRNDKVPLDVEAKARQHAQETGSHLRMVGDQHDVAPGKPPSSKALRDEIPDQAPIDNECDNAKSGKKHAGATRNVIPDLQREHGAGQQEEYAYPGETNA